jgi:hypothetical protein
MFNKSTDNIAINEESSQIINYKIRNKAKVFIITIHNIKILAIVIGEEKEIKDIKRA